MLKTIVLNAVVKAHLGLRVRDTLALPLRK